MYTPYLYALTVSLLLAQGSLELSLVPCSVSESETLSAVLSGLSRHSADVFLRDVRQLTRLAVSQSQADTRQHGRQHGSITVIQDLQANTILRLHTSPANVVRAGLVCGV